MLKKYGSGALPPYKVFFSPDERLLIYAKSPLLPCSVRAC